MNNEYTPNETTGLNIRLNPNDVVKRIEHFLRGERISFSNVQLDTGQLVQTEDVKKTGKPLLNEEGIQNLMLWVETIVNTSTVQGNIDSWSDFNNVISRYYEELNDSLMIHWYDWELKNYNTVLNTIVNEVYMFLTRTVKNKEREALTQTVKTVESTTIQDKTMKKSLPFQRGD